MKTSDKIIIYDDACPLCAAYTSAFVQTGLIDASGRKDFSHISEELTQLIDTERCKSEIPVIEEGTGKVWYGIDGLLEILGQKYPLVKKAGQVRPVKWMLNKLYRLISYNRRVIVARKATPGNFDCTPQLNTRYRFIFMALFLCFNTLMLLPVRQYVMENSLFSGTGPGLLQWAHFGMVAVNISLFFFLPRNTAWEYIGQVNMLALILILLLVPLVWLNHFLLMYDLNNVCFGVLGCFFIHEYRRRMAFAGVWNEHRWIVGVHAIAICGFLLLLTVKI